jgi:hypothetical protein
VSFARRSAMRLFSSTGSGGAEVGSVMDAGFVVGRFAAG